MAMTLLQIIQSACRRIGIAAPSFALASNDLLIQQLVELCNEEGQEQANRFPWEALQSEATFTTVAAEVQTTVAAITSGFDYIINDTIWNRSLRRPVYGPKSPEGWQQAKAMQINGPFNSFRIVGDSIKFNPIPAAGQSCYFEYITENWVTTATGGASSAWTADADTPKLDDQLIVLGTVWRWKHAKGQPYAEDFAKYERRIMDAMVRDAGKPTLNMQGAKYDILPGVFVPAGSWGV